MGDSSSEDRDYFRREAMGAFAHEIRTPLTSLRMVVELANDGPVTIVLNV